MISGISAIDAASSLARPSGGLSVTDGLAPAAATSASATTPLPTIPGDPQDFTDMLADMTRGAVSTVKAGEAAAISGLNGGASTAKVVSAVLEAQSTLQTAIAVRDKVVQAYQELSRMAI